MLFSLGFSSHKVLIKPLINACYFIFVFLTLTQTVLFLKSVILNFFSKLKNYLLLLFSSSPPSPPPAFSSSSSSSSCPLPPPSPLSPYVS